MIQLPATFENRMESLLGSAFSQFCQSLTAPIQPSIRINPKKTSAPKNLTPVPTCETGFYLPQRPLYTLDPMFHAGVYYVQESSSMFLEQFVRSYNGRTIRVLDLCASPGGKSTHLSAMLSDNSLLVCNEVIHSRAMVLSENLKKWGNANVVVTCCDPRDFSCLPGFFDLIVVDAPCSGEGLFRRDPAAIEEWSEANADLCTQRQRRILADIWPALADEGMLVYSTCTFNPAENEENIKWLTTLAESTPVHLRLEEEWGVTLTKAGQNSCYRFYPHRVNGEGFFTSAIRKNEKTESLPRIKNKGSFPLASKSELQMLNGIVQNLPLSVIKFENSLLAFPTSLIPDLELLKANLRLVHAGVRLGEIKQGSLIPAHELAISTILDKSGLPMCDLTLEQAIGYLRKDEIQLSFVDKGWNLVTYRSHPIGWAKNIGNRFNNSYPKEWRIRMATSEFTGDRLKEEAAKFPFNLLDFRAD